MERIRIDDRELRLRARQHRSLREDRAREAAAPLRLLLPDDGAAVDDDLLARIDALLVDHAGADDTDL